MARLRSEGYLVCPASSAVPVELRGVRPDGIGLHFRCRGVTVRLDWYRSGRAAWQTPVWDDRWSPEEALELWTHEPAEPTGAIPDVARLVFPDGGEPDRQVVLDGAREWGWRSHEAGLLPPARAAVLFTRLLDVADRNADPGRAAGNGTDVAAALAATRGGSAVGLPAPPFPIPRARVARPDRAGARAWS
jgi:hypothetical protein